MTSQRPIFFDTTLGDGEQSPERGMNVPGKVQMAHAIQASGITIDAAELDAAYRSFVKFADSKKSIFDLDFLAFVPGQQRFASPAQTLVKC
jgi:isopropylmalate/homocitrate/citramalate synthase